MSGKGWGSGARGVDEGMGLFGSGLGWEGTCVIWGTIHIHL